MKAEHRKELETNALADRVGHLMHRVKGQPRRSTMYYVIGGIVLLVALILGIRYVQVSREEESKRWAFIDIGTQQALSQLATKDSETNAGKAARFEFAWLLYWEGGVKRLGVNGGDALGNLDKAAGEYRKLAEECVGDLIWEPEALYGQAVIEETHAVTDIKRLDSAKKLYEDLATKQKESARGKLAVKWVESYATPEGRRELEQFYQEMQTSLNLVDQNMLRKLLEQGKKKQQENSKGK